MLVEANFKYINKVENSANYLNCPKHILNHALDCMYRQGIVISKERAIQYVYEYLKEYDIPEPKTTAIKFVEWRDSISMQEFNLINVNPYIDKTPPHIEAKHKIICDWVDKNTTYYPAIYGGGIKNIPTHPIFRN